MCSAPVPRPLARLRRAWPRATAHLACTTALLLALSGLAAHAHAQALSQLLAWAQAHDASLQAAQARLAAEQARLEQARALLRPSVGLGAGAQWAHTDTSPGGPSRSSDSQQLGLQATQPLLRRSQTLTVEQAERGLSAARARLQAAEQDLIVRTAAAAFQLLAAQDALAVLDAQQRAVAEQRAAARHAFEVGSATITDTHEAQARYDLVQAQRLAAQNEVQVLQLALEQLLGRSGATPWPLHPGAELPLPQPSGMAHWVERALADNPPLLQARAAAEAAALEVQRAEAALGPTLDAVARLDWNRGPAQGLPGGPDTLRSRNASIGVQFKLPLFSGGGLQARVAEALAMQTSAAAELETAQRSVTQATRSAYLGVASSLAQVQALQSALASSQSALDANRLGLEVGVRTNIDLLNAQSQFFDTQARLARARYEVLLAGLRLRLASGTLQASDVQALDALLRAP